MKKAALAAFFNSGIAGSRLNDYADTVFVKFVTEIL
jgi:hypothetical protein